jgi:hypothetical protein
MNNLFVASSPLQLLANFIIANSIHEADSNSLVLLGECKWEDFVSLKKMASDDSTWKQIINYPHWLGRKSTLSTLKGEISAMQKELGQIGPIDRVFLATDKYPQFQLLVELTGNSSYIRTEDGIWSYNSPDRHLTSKILQRFRMGVFRKLAGIKPLIQFNYHGTGRGQSASADYLFKPALLERPTPQAIAIGRDNVQKAMAKLSRGMNLYSNISGDNLLLLLGSTLVERHLTTVDQELALLERIHSLCERFNMKLVYKPHRAEKADKLNYYQEKLKDIQFLNIADPMEYLYYLHSNLRTVMAHSSSGLLYADLFAQKPIKTIAIANLYGTGQIDAVAARILVNSGTSFPKDFKELESIFDIALQSS